jgi:citrate lyase subunit beta / citryl-CoA lyase
MSDRSFLFVPGNRSERFAKACAAGADAVILDLEDAVAPGDKDKARAAVAEFLRGARPVWIRVNGADTSWHEADLALLGLPGLAGVAVPKAEDPAALRALTRRLPTGLPLMPLVESALGLWNAADLARVEGVTRLAFGSVDFQLDAGITGEGEELLYARSRLVVASRVAGKLPPVDGVTVDIADVRGLAADVARARRLGFGGKLCIHPAQVAAVNDGFLPPAVEIEWARKVVAAAAAAGDNAVRLDGKLVDLPIIERARALLATVMP